MNHAEIVASNAIDPDSTPDNGVRGEDDQAAAVGALKPVIPPTSTEAPGPPAVSSERGLVALATGILALLVLCWQFAPRRRRGGSRRP